MILFGQEMNPVAAIIRGNDNDSYMVASCRERLANVPDSVFCSSCGWKVDWRHVRSDYRLGRRGKDVSVTYDGVTIVSRRVRELLCDHGIDKALFAHLPNDPEFFTLAPDMTVAFDGERRRTRMEQYCGICGLYGIVAGASPAFFHRLPEGDIWIARSDLLFGSYNERHPLIVVSHAVACTLRSAKLTGLDLETVEAEQIGGGQPAPASSRHDPLTTTLNTVADWRSR